MITVKSKRTLSPLGDNVLSLPESERLNVQSTVCPRSSDPFCVVTYCIKWVTTFRTYSNCTFTTFRIVVASVYHAAVVLLYVQEVLAHFQFHIQILGALYLEQGMIFIQ